MIETSYLANLYSTVDALSSLAWHLHQLFTCIPRLKAQTLLRRLPLHMISNSKNINTPDLQSLTIFYSGFEAGPLAEQLSVHTPVPIPYKPPFDWSRWGSIVSLIPIVTLIFRFIKPVLQNRWLWAAGTVFTSLVMTSGYMFTRIRGVPYAGPNGAWIAQGYQNQYGQEVQVVAMVCTSLRVPT